MGRTGMLLAILLGSLLLTSTADAQVTVRIDQAPSQVAPGDTFDVAWTVNSPNPVTLTTVVWGDRSRGWNKLGTLRSGAAGSFRTQLTAPASGDMFWVIYVRTGPVRGVTGERRIVVGTNPGPTPQPPAPASNLTADAQSPTSVELNWNDNANNERAFFIERRTGSAAFGRVANVQADVTTWTDTGLTANTTYEYRVVAANDQGSAPPSNVASVTTPNVQPTPQPPAPASNLVATPVSGTQVDLTWADNSNNEAAFLVGRRVGASGNFTQVAQVGADVTSYSDTAAQPGTSYEYSVFATNAVGTAAGTNVAQATTPSTSTSVTARKTENPPLAIPDNDPTGATSQLVVNDPGKIRSLQVEVDLRHTWRGDVVLRLTSPAGTTITLFDVADNDQDDNVQGTFPTTIAPQESLDRFIGEEMRGVWSLQVVDTQGQDLGDLRFWEVRATIGPSQNPPTFGLERRVPVTTLNFPLNGSVVNPPTALRAVRAFPNLSFNDPVFLTHAGDNTDRVFVVEQGGVIRVFPNVDNVSGSSVFLDIRSRVASGGEMGLLGLAFDPNYAQNRTFYVYYTANSPRRSVVSRFRASSSNPNRADANTEQVILTVNQPYSNHNGGMIAFGPDDMLYVGLGDGGSGGDPQGHGQNRRTLLGNILRINPRSSTTYTIPTDNPFRTTGGGVRPEIWAYGMRNPWRFSFDRTSGQLWCGDVGQNAKEEIDLIRRGGNYGWKVWEGNDRYSSGTASGHVRPVIDYPHSQGRTVVGGYVYRGNRLPGMRGIYIYGDYITDTVWTLKHNGTSVDWNRQVSRIPSLCSFGEDQGGEVFAVSYNGQLYRFEDNSGGGSTSSFPTMLSQTGIFADLSSMRVNPGIVEYDVNAPLWSDNSAKRRWIALPGNDRISFNAQGHWDFPTGTVLIKHFGLEMTVGNPATEVRLETRVLIKENAGWAGYTYKWNSQQTDAALLASADSETYTITDAAAPGGTRQQTWFFPSRQNCMECHTSAAGFVLGPRTGQLNGEFDYPLLRDNQLRSWNHIQLFTTDIGDATQYHSYADPADTSETLSKRVRSYLAVNCQQCHQPGGPAPHTLDLRFETSRSGMNAIDVPPSGGNLGITDPRIIRAGDRSTSVLWNRMNRRDQFQMPLLGTELIDDLGVDLIGQWIDSGAN